MAKSIINNLLYKKNWQAFWQEKERYHRLNNKEKKLIKEFLATQNYKKMTKAILSGESQFSLPTQTIINKIIADKKRVVYYYPPAEQLWLKVLAWEMRSYRFAISPLCFSGSEFGGSKKALFQIIGDKDLHNKAGYKIDIQNYFNEIDPTIMIEVLRKQVDDVALVDLVSKLLNNPQVIYHDEVIEQKKGIMAGTPLSAFLANLYLKEMDDYFYQRQITYARYADDIIVFASPIELDEIIRVIDNFLTKYHLKINSGKTQVLAPGAPFDFLGFNYNNGIIDLSAATVTKTKMKIRRAARSLDRAKNKKNYSTEKVLTLMIKKFNRKFFEIRQDNELNWLLWYFPVLNTTQSLKIIDSHLQNHLRFLAAGKHNKQGFQTLDYQTLKDLGYRTLVNEFYKFKTPTSPT